MGALTLPPSGVVYLDTAAFIYSVEKVAPYDGILQPLWQAVNDGALGILSSELTLLEVLVKPLRIGDTVLASSFRALLTDADEVQLVSVDRSVLEEAAQLRADYGLKTPDAIHAATALRDRCVLFVTNDLSGRRKKPQELSRAERKVYAEQRDFGT